MMVFAKHSCKRVLVGSSYIVYHSHSEYEQLKAKAKELGLTFKKETKKKKPKQNLNGPVLIIKH